MIENRPTVTLADAIALDDRSPLRELRFSPATDFIPPKLSNGSATNGYLLGHSLGLQSAASAERIMEFVASWRERAIAGHFEGSQSWYQIDEQAIPGLALLTGAKPNELVMTGTLTANIHQLLTSFYNPSAGRSLILAEDGGFPSDRYAIDSHVQCRDLEPREHVIRLGITPGEHTLRHEEIFSAIEKYGERLALIMLPAVQFTTGHFLPISKIVEAAHAKGALVGFDLAHATGNVALNLHEWNVDFAAGCGYKYLNAGAGNGAFIFVHERHLNNPTLRQHAGWWGNDAETRFKMRSEFVPSATARRFAVSNPPAVAVISALGGLDGFCHVAENTGGNLEQFFARREQLWRFLYTTLSEIREGKIKRGEANFEIITPENSAEHGGMLSILVPGKAQQLEEALLDSGYVVDSRGENIVRISTVPFWVSAEMSYRLGCAFNKATTEVL